jgi:hypothetical protein
MSKLPSAPHAQPAVGSRTIPARSELPHPSQAAPSTHKAPDLDVHLSREPWGTAALRSSAANPPHIKALLACHSGGVHSNHKDRARRGPTLFTDN